MQCIGLAAHFLFLMCTTVIWTKRIMINFQSQKNSRLHCRYVWLIKTRNLTGLNEASESVKYTDQEIPYEVESSKDVKVLEDGFKVSRNGGSITLKFDGLDESETYLIVEDMDYQSEKQELEEAAAVNLNIEYENNKKTIHYMTDKNNFYCGVKDFLANMGYHRGGGRR